MRCFHIEVNPAILIHLKTNGLRLSQRHSCSELSVLGELSTDSSLHYNKKYPFISLDLFFSENVQSFIFEVVFLPGWCFSIGLRISTLHSWMRIFKPHRISPALRFGPSANTPSQSATASASRPLGPFFQPLKGVAYIHPNKTTAKKFWMLQKLHLLLQLFFLPLQLCLCTIQL